MIVPVWLDQYKSKFNRVLKQTLRCIVSVANHFKDSSVYGNFVAHHQVVKSDFGGLDLLKEVLLTLHVDDLDRALIDPEDKFEGFGNSSELIKPFKRESNSFGH